MNDYFETLWPLVERHVETLRREGQDVIDALSSEPVRFDHADEALHKIKGSSGSIGFKEFSKLTARFQTHVKSLARSNQRRLDEDGRNFLEDFSLALGNLSPAQSDIYQRRPSS